MGHKTLQERVLDLEVRIARVEAFIDGITSKISTYDKVIQSRKKNTAALKKARAAKRKNDYAQKKLAEGFVLKEGKGFKKRSVYEREQTL